MGCEIGSLRLSPEYFNKEYVKGLIC